MSDSAFKFDPPSSASSASDSGSGEDVYRPDSPDNDDNDVIIPPRSPTKVPKSPSKLSASKKKGRTASVASKTSERVVHMAGRTLYTSGRPPWYNTQGQLKETFVIGICGGSASGKTTVARKIIEALDVPWVSLLSMDSFYKVLSKEQHEKANANEYNFDHPDAFDFELLVETVRRLKDGKIVEVPIYNFSTHRRETQMKTIYGANVVIFEGIMAFVSKELCEMMDMKVFVDTDSDIRLARRMKRDISDRGRDLEGVLHQYNKFVKPAFEHYIEPTMTCADIIVPRGGENDVAINLIVMHIHTQLMNSSPPNGCNIAHVALNNNSLTPIHQRGFKLRTKLASSATNGQPMPSTLYVLDKTPQVHGLHTFIRNRETARDEFIFYSKRLMRLLFEYAMSMLPFTSVRVDTQQSGIYEGKRQGDIKVSGVSILRAGETMEPALCEVCKDVSIGKILIQTNTDTGEPELHYLRLPKDIKDHYIMLMDATVATGAAAMMAIRVLLDHDVKEENITLCSLLMAQSGVHSVAYAFPQVKIVTTAVDKEVNEKFHILPGIGNFGDRYFGTDFITEQC